MKNGLSALLASGIDIWNSSMVTESERTFLRMQLISEYPFLCRIITPDEYELLVSSERVLIYGAGNVGKSVERMLNDLGITNYTFVTTSGQDSEKSDVIFQYVDKKSLPVILSVRGRYNDEITKIVKDLRFENIIDLSCALF